MKNLNNERPLYSLTIGEYLELHRSMMNELKALQPNETTHTKELLTIQEAADLLNLSVATLYTMNCHNRIPFTKVSGKVYYRRSVLMEWLGTGDRKTTLQLRREIEEGR